MLLLMHDTLEAIEYLQAIFNFTMLAQYISYDDKILRYIEHMLYKLEKIKIVFEQYWPINAKLYQSIFNCPKFYEIYHFIQCIWDYSSIVNYNTAHSKAVYKYFLKTFYNKTNKKKYNFQIWQDNI